MRPFNLFNTDLSGTHLIEAGAGTGKTYTITGLYLRLILEKKTPAEQILVVTFTKAATEELKERIRRALVECRVALKSGRSDNGLIADLIRNVDDPLGAAERIQDALRNFDSSAIYTIHGFCHRLLYEHAFETGGLFDSELITDQTPLTMSVAQDFWRQRFYQAPPEFISHAVHQGVRAEYCWNLMKKAANALIRIIPPTEETALTHLDDFRVKLGRLKAAWRDDRGHVAELLRDDSLNANVYGSLARDGLAPPPSKRDLKIIQLLDGMDRFTHDSSIGIPLFKGFEKFTAGKVQQSVKKGHPMISHRFFDRCEEVKQALDVLETQLNAALIRLKSDCLAFAETELSQRKRHRNVQFFDDLLHTVHQALTGPRGFALADRVRNRYRAALVDEFQDTDMVQFEIFSKLFDHQEGLLFMIGDPKQSIYSFRGADVFSYMKASATAAQRHTLLTNYRSEPGLIQAVNTIFSHVKNPFVFDEIPFEKGQVPERADGDTAPGKPSLKLWWLSSSPGQRPMAVEDAVHRIAQAVAGETTRLINDPLNGIVAADIAVLVRTNDQAQIVKTYLTAVGVPAVLYSAGNVFDTLEAMEMERVLKGIANFRSPRRLRAALVTHILGISADRLDPEQLDLEWWESKTEDFMAYREEWNSSGFIQMFSHLLNREKVRSRLLSMPDGERRLTNLLHLSELLHAACLEKGLGIAGLLKWLMIQRDPQTPRLEADQLRLESDRDTVKIITIHKSKGLEYPVVFCPFAWGKSRIGSSDTVFHDQREGNRLTLDLGSSALQEHQALARNEMLSENLRLLYVSITRAKKMCYLVWGRINTAETSAMAYLLHGLAEKKDAPVTDDITDIIGRGFRGKEDDDLWHDLETLEKRSNGSIEVLDMPMAPPEACHPEKAAVDSGTLRQFSGRIDRTWRISSYSSLTSRMAADQEMPDRDAFGTSSDSMRAEQIFAQLDGPARKGDGSAGASIFSFPKGAAAGIFFHDLLEHLDFADEDEGPVRDLTSGKLKAHGFSDYWLDPVLELARQLRSVPLSMDPGDLTLSRVGMDRRLNELEFFFPLAMLTPDRIRRLFAEAAGLEATTAWTDHVERLVFSPTHGFMKGYIDMLFEAEGKYYVVDWKSNFLGDSIADYQQKRLEEEMVRSFYTLQYHIYVLATHLFLQRRKPGYDYDRDFGGVFYFFIRGVRAGLGPEYGIFADRPDRAVMNALGRTLVPGYEV